MIAWEPVIDPELIELGRELADRLLAQIKENLLAIERRTTKGGERR